jgi:AcrR family transcriptional regulator
MPKVSQSYLDDRREQILAAARRCFLRDGFHATSMQDLFEESKLSSGAVYRYFASKEEMIVAIAEANLREVISLVHAIASQEPGTSVGEAIACVVEAVQAKHDRDGLAGLAIQVWAEALRNPALAHQFAALMGQVRTELVEVVRQQQNQGRLPTELPADAFATVLLSIVPGAIVHLALIGGPAVGEMPNALRALWT